MERAEIVRSVRWSDDGAGVRIIDQRQLPARETTLDLRTIDDVCDAIRTLAVRGAPAIGIAAAMGLVVSMVDNKRLGCATSSCRSSAPPPNEFARRDRPP